MKRLFLILFAFFGLTPSLFSATLLYDNTFNEGSDITQTPTYNGLVNQWLSDGNWHKSLDTPHDGSKYAQTTSEEKRSLYQVTNLAGISGDISISYWYQTTPSGIYTDIFGSNEKPAIGSSWDQSTWTNGNPFGTIVWSRVTSGAYSGGWEKIEHTYHEDDAFTWYTVRIRGKSYFTDTGHGDHTKIDDIFIDIPTSATVPEPSVAILFLFGLGILRRYMGLN